MQLTDAECRALAKQPATVLKALTEVVQTVEDLEQLVLAIARHPQAKELAHVYDQRRREITAALAVVVPVDTAAVGT